MPARRAAAPRLIDWTGERAVPWAPDVRVLYEHYHRYLWARALVDGLDVLDLGSGEGFGAALLAEAAASVTGIDIDAHTVEHSQLNYCGPGLTFGVGSATDLSRFPDGAFGVVVAFEILEHLEDQELMLAEVARVLAPDGILLMSTPDRRAYSEATGQLNPFHVRELSEPEFRALLGTRFTNTWLFGQRTATGSHIESIDLSSSDSCSHFRLEQAGDEWREAGPPSPLYLIAMASQGTLPQVPRHSSLSDYDLGLLREAERAAAERDAVRREQIERAEAAGAAEVARSAQERARVTAAREREQSELLAEREARIAADSRVAELSLQLESEGAARIAEAVGWARELDVLAGQVTAGEAQVAALETQHERERRELQRVRESVTWRAFLKVRGRVYGALGGPRSLPSRAIGMTLRTVGQIATSPRKAGSVAASPPEPTPTTRTSIVFPTFTDPAVSIVIPVYADAGLTERCLRAILHATDEVTYEVVVVDDGTDAEVRDLLARTRGAVVLRNEHNLGYLRSANRGAAEASGEHIVHLNSDTEPQRGWLVALMSRLQSDDAIGVVVPKLLFPDGRLQEAGSIVWRDGGAWNYGHGGDEAASAFNFVRDVDYGSAAAMLVRGSVWRELGGFDERYGPGYYEDVDFCFAVRAADHRVVYEPNSRVIHELGGTMGTDLAVGLKRYQIINRDLFAEKWREDLSVQVPGPSQERLDAAADRRVGRRVFIVDHAVPEPDQDAGSLRMFHLIENLTRLGRRVTFMPDNHAATAPYTANLQALGVEVLYGHVHLAGRLAGIAHETDLVILSRPYVAARYLHLVREHLPAATVAYDTVDLHYVRERRRAELEGDRQSRKSHSFKELELGVARAADLTLVVSQEEARTLGSEAPEAEVVVVPLANATWSQVPPRTGRSDLLFVGNFGHTPNVDAATFLVRRVMPLVWRAAPAVRVTLAGGNAPAEVMALASPMVDVVGWVPDLDPLVAAAAVMVAPLRYGAGVKGKVTQALAGGLPVVTTSLGAEGLDAKAGEEILIGEAPEELAAQIVRVLSDADLWQRLSDGGQALLSRTSSVEAQREAVAGLLQAADACRSERR